MKILIVEDQEKLALSIQKGLSLVGFTVDVVGRGDTALDRMMHNSTLYDCIVLDRMLPGVDGLTLAKTLREKSINVPILMLTALDAVHARVEGLEGGADDYLAKPFDFTELVARVRALLRRPPELSSDILAVHGIEIDMTAHKVTRAGREIILTAKEFSILHYLMIHKDQVVTREQIMNHAWDYAFDGASNVVDVHLKNLRKKIQKKNETIFETVHGVGYKFIS